MMQTYPELYENISSGIYTITNLINNKIYVGSSINLKERIATHKRLLNKNNHHSKKLQNSWNKCGKNNFKFEIIERSCWFKFLIVREQYWIDFYNSYNNGYNAAPYAKPCVGNSWTEERKLKQAAFMRTQKYALGYKHTAEAIAKTSMASKARRFSNEVKEGRRQRALGNKYALGMKHSEEARAKMSTARRNSPLNINGEYLTCENAIKKYGTVDY